MNVCLKYWLGAVALTVAAGNAAAQPPNPGSDLMRPGSNAVGTPNYGPSVKASSDAAAGSPDKNGDGYVDASEVEPGSRWATRLKHRDYNGDGKISRDEYWFP
ncbi:MAG: hypothetical protein PHP86_12000 [Nevskiales bacterium]|nr:hypothetical protein [Nevskiales bacterium]